METQAGCCGGRVTSFMNVCGAALGMAVGFAAIFISTNGVFIPAVLHDFHWGRAQAAQSYSASMLGLALVSPLIGILMDRFGVRKVVIISAFFFAVAMACMGLQDGNKVWWIGLSLIIGMSGAATSVLGYLAILPQWFDRRLGLAIGFAMVGLGVGTIVLPALSAKLIAMFGWRTAYQVLAAISLAGALVAFFMLRENREVHQPKGAVTQGARSHSAVRHKGVKVFVIFVGAFLASSAVLSLGPHLPALLMDRGISAQDAAKSASLIGLGILVGRLSSGFLVDRVHAPFVACCYFLCGAAGFILLGQVDSYQGALLASVLVGLAIGAEGDLLSYLVRAYVGLERFGLFYGIVFSGYSLGAVVGPVVTGHYFDTYKNYSLPLQAGPVLLVVASVLFVSLGRYARPGLRRGDPMHQVAIAGE